MSRAEVLRPKMPLSFVPEAERRSPSTEKTRVAGHELNHALVAIGLGVPIVSLSVIP